MSARTKMLTNAVNAHTSATYKVQSVDVLISYGGVFDGGSVTLNMLEQGNWEPITDGVFTSPGQKLLQIAQGIEIQAVTSGGGGSMAVNLSMLPRY